MKHLFVILALLWASLAGATTRYVAQTAGTFSGGMHCNGQTAVTPATWNATTLAGDDIAWICGTLTGGAGSTILAPHNGGTSGHPIVINFDSGASIQAPYFATSGGINLGSSAFIIIDGGTNGFIQATLNGTSGGSCPGGTCTNQQSTTGIGTSGGNIEIRNLLFADGYDHTSTSDTSVSNSGVNCVQFSGSNVSIHDNVMHDWSWCLYEPELAGDGNVTIYNNIISRVDHGWALGPSGHSGGTNGPFSFHDNQVSSYANWDATGGFHHDGVHCYTSGTTGVAIHISLLSIYNNLFNGPVGTNITAHVFIEGGSGGSTTPCMDSTSVGQMYNNVFLTDSNANLNNGMAGIFSGNWSTSPGGVFDNTFVGVSTSAGVGFAANSVVSGMTFKNNVLTGFNQIMAITNSISFTTDFNIYANGGSNAFVCNTNFFNTSQFLNWKTCIGGDANSSYNASAGLSATGTVNSGSVVIGAGTNLTSLSITPLDSTTSAGNTVTPAARPGSAAWDAGAYQFSSTPTAGTPSCSPGSGVVPQTVTCTVAGGAPVQCFTTNGTTPATNGTSGCTAGTLVSGTISVSVAETLKVIAGGTGFLDGSVGSFTYTATPVTAPATGMFATITVNPVPVQATSPMPTLTKSSPVNTYLSARGFSQDGIVFSATLNVTLTGTNLNVGAASCTLDGITIPCSCSTAAQCVATLTASALAIPTKVTAHSIGLNVAAPAQVPIPVLQ